MVIESVVVAVVCLFLFFIMRKRAIESRRACSSPDCLRCTNYAALFSDGELNAKKSKFIQSHPTSSDITSVVEALEVMQSVKDTLQGDPMQAPTVFLLKGIETKTNWTDDPRLKTVCEKISKHSKVLLEEYMACIRSPMVNWAQNNTPSGVWSTIYLFNQGHGTSNRNLCPETAYLLDNIDCFMDDSIFGNAFFSVLAPNSIIEPHCGPTNLRLRLHLTLVLDPPGSCSLTIKDDLYQWKKDDILVFDDSFLHSAVSTSDLFSRVVFIVDLWHPEVTKLQRQFISELFSM